MPSKDWSRLQKLFLVLTPVTEAKFLQLLVKSSYYAHPAASPKERKVTAGFLCQWEAINSFIQEVITNPILDASLYTGCPSPPFPQPPEQ